MPALHFTYFEEGSSKWGMRRPQTTAQASRTSFSILCMSVANKSDDVASKVSKLAELVSTHAPTFIILNEVTLPFYTLLKENQAIRAGYAVTEFSSNQCNVLAGGANKQVDHTSCFLIAHYVPLPFAEHNIKSEFNSEYKVRPFAVVYIRGFLGLQFAIGALHFDPLNIVGTRASAISKCLEKVDPSESPVALVFANYLESTSSAVRTELPIVLDKMSNFHWTDVNKLQPEANDSKENCGLWMRQNDGNPVVVQSCTVLSTDDLLGYSALTCFKAGEGQSPGSGITIPQPRSAKVEPPKADVRATSTPMAFDPAVVSVDKSPASLPTQTSASAALPQQQRPPFPNQPVRVRRWFADRITHIRRAPDNEERDYDLNTYKTVDEAVRALNGSFQWGFDYMIIGSNLLYCEGTKPSYPAFKRYCLEHQSQMAQWRKDNNLPTGKAARLAAQRQPAAPLDVGSDDHQSPASANAPSSATAGRQDSAASTLPPPLASIGNTIPSVNNASPQPIAAVSPNAPNSKHLPARQRVWSEHSASIVYQTTPLEMRFDISGHVGQAKNNLASAIERLNSRNKKTDASGKPDPLSSFTYDYALLFNSDRQGYWLIACTDVPCDVVACRNYAYRLSN